MSYQLENKGEMACAWTAVIAMFFFITGWILCFGWLFPPPPSLGAEDIVNVYAQNTTGIRIGVIMMGNFGGSLTVVFAALITVYMLRMRGPSPVLAWTQIACGAINVLIFIIPAQIYAATAYRLDRSPEITQFGNDIAWMIFDMVVGPTQIQWLVIGFAILYDKSKSPIFPRWFAYFNFWAAFIILLNNMILFFKAGPFAWNGLLGWWPGAIIFCTWYFVAFYVVRKAILNAREIA